MKVYDEQNQQVTVRCLPGGELIPAFLNGINRETLRVTLAPSTSRLSPGPGDLLEVNCPGSLYLGEVSSSDGEALTVLIEHAIDRATLRSIQQVWYVPDPI